MKKIFIIVLLLLIIIVLSVFDVVNKGSENTIGVFNKLKDNLSIKYDKINNISYYYGDNTYFVVEYGVDNIKWYAIVDEKEKVIDKVNVSDLYDDKKIKSKFTDDYEFTVGYNDGFIYEVKVNNKDNYMYYYYDAKSGKNTNVITIKK
jgi:hypothetical protein